MPEADPAAAPIGLGFDTSAAHCAAALVCGDNMLASAQEQMAKGQAERLFPMIEELLSSAGVRWDQITVVGVGTGPGNFTGIRVSVAAARGLSLSLGVPAIGVSLTEAAAFGIARPCRVVLSGKRDTLIWEDFYEDRGAAEASRPQQAVAGALPPGPEPASPVVALPVAIARIALERRDGQHPRPAPLYLRPADAAPSRDLPPVILG